MTNKNEPTLRVRPMPTDIAKYSIELFKRGASSQLPEFENKRCAIRVTELLRYKQFLLTNGTYNATFRPGIVRRKLVLLPDHFVVLQHCGDLALRHHVHHLIAACLELAD